MRVVSRIVFLGLVILCWHFGPVAEATAQVTQEWVSLYNGPANSFENATGVTYDAAGNVYVTGSSNSATTGSDFATIKYDANGNQLWVSTYNGPGNGSDIPVGVAVDAAGNVYVAGPSTGSGTNFDSATIKYDANGNQLWAVRYDRAGNSDNVRKIAVDAAGNVYVAVSSFQSATNFDFTVIKYNSSGGQQWISHYNNFSNTFDDVRDLAVDAAGNVYITGLSWSNPNDSNSGDYATVKYNSSGVQQWVRRYNGPGNHQDDPRGIAVDAAGNVYVTGFVRTSSTNTNAVDYATVKYSSSGVQQWVSLYNGTSNNRDLAFDIAVDDMGGVFVTGQVNGSTGDYGTVRYDAITGVQDWLNLYNGPGFGADFAIAMTVDNSGDVYVTGRSTGSGTNNDYGTVKYNGASGNEEWVERYNGAANSSDLGIQISADDNGNVYVTGNVTNSNQDFGTIKYSQAPAGTGVALDFSGDLNSGSFVDASDAGLPLGSASRTIEAWVKVENGQGFNEGYFVSYGSLVNTQGILLGIFSGQLVVTQIGGGVVGGIPINDDTWHHVAVTLEDQGGGSAIYRLYQDGVAVGATLTLPTNTTSNGSMQIGKAMGSPAKHINGVIDEVRIWDTARTLAQIQGSMNAELNGSEPGLVSYWRMNEGSGLTTLDEGRGINGTLMTTGANLPIWTTPGFPQVVPTNQPPVADDGSDVTNEDTPLNGTLSANDPDGDPLLFQLVTPPTQGVVNIIPNTGAFTYIPFPDSHGSDSFTFKALDDEPAESNIATMSLTINSVNDPPAFTKGPDQTVLEDAAAQSIVNWATGIIVGPANESGQTPTFNTTNDNNALFSVQPSVSPDGTLSYTPAADANGSATITVQLMDDGGTDNGGVDVSLPETATINVTPVNDVPAFTRGPDQSVLEDAGAQSIANWATGLSPGPANESGQTLSFNTSNDNNGLFSSQPTISSDGTLSYTPAADANGSATVTVTVMDDGGTDNGGVDTSAPQTFDISVTPVNDAPTFTAGPDQTVQEDAGAQSVPNWATGISPGPADESGQTLSFNTSNDNNALFTTQPSISPDGTLTYETASMAFGTATVTTELMDNGGTANGGVDKSGPRTFTITATPVNDPPVADDGTLVTLEDNAANGTLTGSDGDNDPLTFSVDTPPSKGSVLIDDASAGTYTYTPNANENGSDSFTFVSNDGTVNSDPATITVTITPVNDAPAFTAGPDQTVSSDAGSQSVSGWATGISPGPADESGQTLSFNTTNDNNGLFTSQPSISSDGTLTYTPDPLASGTATVTAVLSDDGGTDNGGVDTSAPQTFTIEVTPPANDPPVVTDGTLTTNEDNAASGTLTGSDGDNDPLTFSIDTPPSKGNVSIDDASTGDYTYTPNADENGSDSFTFKATDDEGAESNTGTVNVTVNPVNDAPGFTAGADQSASNDAGPQSVPGWATDISPGPADESGQTLSFNTTNDNNTLFDDQPSISSDGTLSYTPANGASGDATVTVTLSDNGGTDNGGVDTSGPQTFAISITDPSPQDLPQTVILATHRVWIKKNADIKSGNIIANGYGEDDEVDEMDDESNDHDPDDQHWGYCPYPNHRHRAWRWSNVDLRIGKKAMVASGFDVKADRIFVKRQAQIASDVFYNALKNKGAITGALHTPLDLPVIAQLPPFVTGAHGSQNIVVKRARTETLPPGDYGTIRIKKGGRLILTGGVYNIESIQTGRSARILFEGASEVRVEGKMMTGARSYVGPASGSGIQASDIIFYVAGENERHWKKRSWRVRHRVVKFGSKNVVYANVYAPNGTIWLRVGSKATGAFIGKRVVVGVNVKVTLDSYFGTGTGVMTRVIADARDADMEADLYDLDIPDVFSMEQNYPNPFNPETEISYDLPEQSHVILVIYNMLGQEVQTLVNEVQPAGFYSIRWNGRNGFGQAVGSGVYLYRIQAGDFSDTRRMTLLK